MNKLCLVFAFLLMSSVTRAQLSDGNPIEIKASPYIVSAGAVVEISGSVANTKKPQKITLQLNFPGNIDSAYLIKTNDQGIFLFKFKSTSQQGMYIVSATPEDEKLTDTDTFYVLTTKAITTEIQNTQAKLTTTIEHSLEVFLAKAKQLPKDEGLDEKLKKLDNLRQKLGKTKADDEKIAKHLKDYLEDWRKAPEGLIYIQKTYISKLDALREDVNKQMPVIESKITKFENVSKTCELIALTTELFGYVSFCLDFKAKFSKIVINLASDKVLPGILDRKVKSDNETQDEHLKMKINTTQKSMIAIAGGATETIDFLKEGLVLDMGQYLSKILYLKYCDELKGPVSSEFAADFYNNGTLYATYKVKLTGDLTLRFNKDANLKSGTEITGEFNGFRTFYNFMEAVENVEPFPPGSVVILRKTITPTPVDLNSIKNDLGILVSSLVPGSFKVGVSAQVSNNKLKLVIENNPVFDLETTENNRLILVLAGALLPIPMIHTFDIPITSNKIMLRVALGEGGHTFDLKSTNGKYSLDAAISNKRKLDDINLAGSLKINLKSN